MKIKDSVECWVLRDGRPPEALLLQVPARPGQHEAFWQPVTGGIEEGETPREACLREVHEETGLQFALGDLAQVADGFEVVISPELTIRKSIYTAYVRGDEITINPHEHRDHHWFPPERIADQLYWQSNKDTWHLVAQAHELPTQPSPPAAMTQADLDTLGNRLQAHINPLGHAMAHHNQHFTALRHDGTRLFGKLIEDVRPYYTAEVSVGDHLADVSVPVPPMVDHGELAPDRFWVAYAWCEIRPFTPELGNVEAAGAALGELHDRTRGITDERLRYYASISELLTDKINLVTGFDVDLGARLTRLRSRLSSSEAAFTELGETPCLLHCDFGWRNLGLDTHEQPLLFDFEHAAVGTPILEFAKLWDRELWDPDVHTAFFHGYQRHSPLDWPTWRIAIDAVRLWAAAGIIPYARSREDHAFEQHAHTILDRLEAPTGQEANDRNYVTHHWE